MGKLIFQMMVSLDGYHEGPDGEIDWHVVENEFNNYAADLLDKVDALIFGLKIKLNLKLIQAKALNSSLVMIYYKPNTNI
ncbi:hypothetical protein EHS11_11485 [Leptospira ilyithenensis]|uniref:Bacterial bifunctional deaminase-reductase C-terminal domain-containing protein n=1 Tax=Leptospira ilyithenensis TaxID=2484901 RepID=A0A4R9LPU7_9LEPT|nr:dihydrofolate reductase family protein [Leptospira ilyithenensis]TGN09703.1 hypothetical protein EHS11_11485 [Leptospira ilyithenensis]